LRKQAIERRAADIAEVALDQRLVCRVVTARLEGGALWEPKDEIGVKGVHHSAAMVMHRMAGLRADLEIRGVCFRRLDLHLLPHRVALMPYGHADIFAGMEPRECELTARVSRSAVAEIVDLGNGNLGGCGAGYRRGGDRSTTIVADPAHHGTGLQGEQSTLHGGGLPLHYTAALLADAEVQGDRVSRKARERHGLRIIAVRCGTALVLAGCRQPQRVIAGASGACREAIAGDDRRDAHLGRRSNEITTQSLTLHRATNQRLRL